MRSLLMPILVNCCLVSLAPSEDVLQLRDGSSVRGILAGATPDAIAFSSSDGRQTSYPRSQVASIAIDRDGAAKPPPAAAAAGSSSGTAPAAPAAAVPVPAGTELLVRTRDAIDSRRQGAGTRFEAALDNDLVVGGATVAPKGSVVYGEVRNAKQSGHLVGKSEVELALTGVQIGGRLVPCATDAAVQAGESQGRDTARKAGAGALVGAAADGSEGARKGAAVGGAVALVTRGSSVQIPPGTLLGFHLVQPMKP